MWTFDANAPSLIDNFAAVVETDTASKGSWQLDYEMFCEKFHVTRCPFVKSAMTAEDKESCRIMNTIVDLSSWRAMLLACCTTGSKIVEICVHGSRLDPQHLLDLSAALRKMGTCQSLKLQYLDLQLKDENFAQYQEAFTSILNDGTCLEYVSFKGNNLTDEFAAPLITSLAQNFKLVSLNLANNCLTDASLQLFWKAVRCTTTVKMVSFESNKLTGESLLILGEMLMGSEYNAEDDATFKGNVKVVGERNKQIKEVNKKRKKAGLVELKEIAPTLECSAKKEKTLIHANRSLRRVDLSHNPLLEVDKLNSLVQLMTDTPPLSALPPAAATATAESKVIVDITSSVALPVDFNFNPQPWIEFIA